MDFLILEIRDSNDKDWIDFMTDVFQHIVDNYDYKEIDNIH